MSEKITENSVKQVVPQRQVIEFFTVANEFCRLIETASKFKQAVFMETMLRLLSLMYLKGSLLPKLMPIDENAYERFVNEEQWEEIYLSLKDLLADEDVFDKEAIAGEAEPGHENSLVKGSIAEYLTDIWQDIKDFVLLYNKTNIAAKENAVWACYLLFRENWGLKSAEIVKALHQKVFMNIDNHNIDE